MQPQSWTRHQLAFLISEKLRQKIYDKILSEQIMFKFQWDKT